MSRRFSFFIALIVALLLGVIAVNSTTTIVEAQVTQGQWIGQFYADTGFSSPVGTYSYPSLNFNWQGVPQQANGQPVPGMPADNFSVRFTKTVANVPAGNYTFSAIADDQMTLRVNGTQVIQITTATYSPVSQAIQAPGGTLSLQVDFVEFQGPAVVQLTEPNYGGGPPGSPIFTPTPTITVPPSRTPLPPIPPGAITATVIRAAVLNVRDAPTLGGNKIGQILRGETYAIVGRDPDARWFLLQLGGYQGWSWGYYLFIDGNEFNPPITSSNVVLGLASQPDFGVRGQANATLRLRQAPTVAAVQTGRITWGAFLPIIGRTADGFWYKVVWKDTVGWAYGPFIDIVDGDLNVVPIE